jgi:hypothetical protein
MNDTDKSELSIRQLIVNCFNGDDTLPTRAIGNLEALITQQCNQARIDEASRLSRNIRTISNSELRRKLFAISGWGLIFKDEITDWAAGQIANIVNAPLLSIKQSLEYRKTELSQAKETEKDLWPNHQTSYTKSSK